MYYDNNVKFLKDNNIIIIYYMQSWRLKSIIGCEKLTRLLFKFNKITYNENNNFPKMNNKIKS